MAKRRNLERNVKQRKPYTVILIIGEGQTEAAYFHAIKQYLRARTLRLEIEPVTSKSDPLHLLKTAKLRQKSGDYDWIFCVFDGDKPEEAQQAQQAIAKHTNIRGFVSTPYFEVWLLLHFARSDAPLTCEQAESKLKEHWNAYQKGCDCRSLMPVLNTACTNAAWLEQRQRENRYSKPTHFYL